MTFTSITWSHSATLISSKGAYRTSAKIAALFTSPVDTSVVFVGGSGHGLDAVLVGDVGLDEERIPFLFPNPGGAGLPVEDIRHHDLRSGLGQFLGVDPADAAGAAGDDDDLAVESWSHG